LFNDSELTVGVIYSGMRNDMYIMNYVYGEKVL